MKKAKQLDKELEALKRLPESKIDLSEMPETTAGFWAGAERGKLYRPVKKHLSVRIDADVVVWLKSQGKGYQGRMNDLLRSEMLKHRQEL